MEKVKTNNLLKNIEDGIMKLTLNRPERLNAFSTEMINGLISAMNEAKSNSDVRVVVIQGSGRAFCAGGDVKRMGNRTPLETYQRLGNLNNLILLMKDLEKPIVTAVHGYAAGAGFNLALASDIILAADDSKFILSFSKVGLISDGGGLYFLPRLIGTHRAKELLFNAEPISAEKAYSLGIVNQIYPLDEFTHKVDEYAKKLAAGPLNAYGFIKKIADQALNSNLEEILELERITQATVITTEDHKEGIQAFKEKRVPVFRSKKSQYFVQKSDR